MVRRQPSRSTCSKITFIRLQIVVHQPALASVDRIDHARAARVDGAGAPGALVPLPADQVGGADEGRLHALDDGVAGELGADRLAHHGARAVAPDQEAALDAPDRPGIEIAQVCPRGPILHDHVFDRGAVDDADPRLRGRMLEQDRLEKNLVDAMRRLRRRPVAIRATLSREAVAATGNFDPRQLAARERGTIADVVRIVRRQACVAHLVGDAEPPEDFHGPRGNVVAFRFGGCRAGARFHYRHIDAAPRQIDRQRKADRSGANNKDLSFGHSASMPKFLIIAAQRSTSVLT
jgi:hypothetical protein